MDLSPKNLRFDYWSTQRVLLFLRLTVHYTRWIFHPLLSFITREKIAEAANALIDIASTNSFSKHD